MGPVRIQSWVKIRSHHLMKLFFRHTECPRSIDHFQIESIKVLHKIIFTLFSNFMKIIHFDFFMGFKTIQPPPPLNPWLLPLLLSVTKFDDCPNLRPKNVSNHIFLLNYHHFERHLSLLQFTKKWTEPSPPSVPLTIYQKVD